MAGETVPYTVRGDNAMALILLIGFISMIISASGSRGFIFKQLKSLFYLPKNYDMTMSETSTELRFQFFMVLLTSLLYDLHLFPHQGIPVLDSELDILWMEKKFTMVKDHALHNHIRGDDAFPHSAIVVIL